MEFASMSGFTGVVLCENPPSIGFPSFQSQGWLNPYIMRSPLDFPTTLQREPVARVEPPNVNNSPFLSVNIKKVSPMPEGGMSYITSKRGRRMAVLDDFIYGCTFETYKKIYWRCSVRTCRAKGWTMRGNDSSPLVFTELHNHPGNAADVRKRSFMNTVKTKMRDNVLSVEKIYSKEKESVERSSKIQGHLPDFNSIKSALYRERRRLTLAACRTTEKENNSEDGIESITNQNGSSSSSQRHVLEQEKHKSPLHEGNRNLHGEALIPYIKQEIHEQDDHNEENQFLDLRHPSHQSLFNGQTNPEVTQFSNLYRAANSVPSHVQENHQEETQFLCVKQERNQTPTQEESYNHNEATEADASFTDLRCKAGNHVKSRFCNVCGKSFTERMLVRVRIRIHREPKAFQCKLKFPLKSSSVQRRPVYSAENLSTTVRRKLSSRRPSPFGRFCTHQKAQGFGDNSVCSICTKISPSRHTLQFCYSTSQLGLKDGCKSRCIVCKKACKSLRIVRGHYVIRLDRNPHLCDACALGSEHNAALVNHSARYSQHLPYLCEKCGYAFRKSSYLRYHMKVHDHIVFTCEKCRQTLTPFLLHSSCPAPPGTSNPADDVPPPPYIDCEVFQSDQMPHISAIYETQFDTLSELHQHKASIKRRKFYFRVGSTDNLRRQALSGQSVNNGEQRLSHLNVSHNQNHRHPIFNGGNEVHTRDMGNPVYVRSECDREMGLFTSHVPQIIQNAGPQVDINAVGLCVRPSVVEDGSKSRQTHDANACHDETCVRNTFYKASQEGMPRRYACQMCEKRFFTNDVLKDYFSLQVSEKPHRCNICGNNIAYYYTSKEHVIFRYGPNVSQKPPTTQVQNRIENVLGMRSQIQEGSCNRLIVEDRLPYQPVSVPTIEPSFGSVSNLQWHPLQYSMRSDGENENQNHVRANQCFEGDNQSGDEAFPCQCCGRMFYADPESVTVTYTSRFAKELHEEVALKIHVCGECKNVCPSALRHRAIAPKPLGWPTVTHSDPRHVKEGEQDKVHLDLERVQFSSSEKIKDFSIKQVVIERDSVRSLADMDICTRIKNTL